MSESQKLPDIEILSALNPKEQSGALYSPNLSSRVQEYGSYEGAMWEAFMSTEPGELDELSKAKKLASYYLLKTAESLQNEPKDELLWVERFNRASEEMYGTIDPQEAVEVAAKELREIETGQPDSYAARVYRQLLGGAESERPEQEWAEQLEVIRGAVFDRFGKMAEIIGSLPEGPYDSSTVRSAFGDIVRSLAQEDDGWSDWTVSNTEGKTMLSVMTSKKQIDVPDGRGPVGSRGQLLGLALHEIGVHAQRSVNGYKTDDELIAKGLPDYTDFEEGLGVLFEYLATGSVPDKIVDRYIDIALATGAVDGLTLSRAELIELGISREAARASARNHPEPDAQDVRKGVVDHVNRLFRGGKGQPVLDQDGTLIDQPVFNKDLVYYEGFVKVRDFVARQVDAGTPERELIDYLLSGKFDATNTAHVAYMAEHHNINL